MLRGIFTRRKLSKKAQEDSYLTILIAIIVFAVVMMGVFILRFLR